MKKIIRTMGSSLAALTLVMVGFSMNVTCAFFVYEEKPPKLAENFKKFQD